MAQPTNGSIKAIYNDQKDSPLYQNPVVQVINIKKVPTSNNVNRYRVIISDGTYFMQAMLASQHTALVENETLQKYSLIVLKDYVCNTLQNRKIIIALNIEVLPNGPDMHRIGSPVNLEAELGQESGAKNNNDQQNGQQQLFVQNQPQQNTSAPNPYNNNANNAASINNASARSNNVYAEANLFPIKTLNPYQNRWIIKARVTQKSDIKFWHKGTSEGKLFSVNLLDKSGEIKATAFNAEVDRLHSLLQENKTYYISKARVSMAKKQFSNLNNDYELVFDSNSEVEECNDDSIPTMSFDFVEIAKLDNGIEKGDTVDIIGVVKDDEGIQEIVSRASGKPVKKRQLTIVDMSKKQVKLTLWDRQAESFDSTSYPVVACKGCRVSDFGGRSLSLLSSGTLKVNPDIPEAKQLRQWYDGEGQSAYLDSFSGSSLGNTENSSSSSTATKTLAEVKSENLGVGDKADFFNVRARVVYMKSENCWYPACPECKKKLIDEGGSWRCEKDQKQFPEPDYRYILSLSISDATTQMFMSAFDEVGNKILGRSATEMVRLKDSDNVAYQNAFKDSYFYPYTFKCKAKMESYNEQQRTKYTIVEATAVDYVADGNQLANEIDSYLSL
ncbi:putative replication factor-A protein 1 [Umbelopsis sp. PMI_123]|nr:putative replication factor-A protein 1 [Umbelopsis sp. PMI_123]